MLKRFSADRTAPSSAFNRRTGTIRNRRVVSLVVHNHRWKNLIRDLELLFRQHNASQLCSYSMKTRLYLIS
jgi:hypothetical protein